MDAQHPDTLVVAELNRWWPDVNLWRSTDGGATWRTMWDWGPWPTRIFHYVHDISGAPWLTFGVSPALPEVSPKLGWMVGDIEIDPFNSDRMLYGTGATIYGTDDLTNWDAGTPVNITVQAQGLEETAVQDLISPPQGAPLLSALGDIGGFRHDDLSTVPAMMYTNPVMGTANSLDYAELHPSVIFRAGQGQWPYAGYSTDGGTSWTPVGSSPRLRRGHRRLRRRRGRRVESVQRRRPCLDRQRQHLDGIGRDPLGRAGRVRSREPARGSTDSRAESSIAATTPA